MSETPINLGTSGDRVQFPVWRTLINLVIAVLSATLAPFLVCIFSLPIALVLVALSTNPLPGVLKGLTEAVGGASYLTVYFGTGITLCVGIQFVIFGLPTAILGWRLGRITWLSSIIAGFLIGCLPWVLVLPFDQTFGPDNPFSTTAALMFAGAILAMGVLGAFEGFLFWLVWRLLSKGSVPAKRPERAPG